MGSRVASRQSLSDDRYVGISRTKTTLSRPLDRSLRPPDDHPMKANLDAVRKPSMQKDYCGGEGLLEKEEGSDHQVFELLQELSKEIFPFTGRLGRRFERTLCGKAERQLDGSPRQCLIPKPGSSREGLSAAKAQESGRRAD